MGCFLLVSVELTQTGQGPTCLKLSLLNFLVVSHRTFGFSGQGSRRFEDVAQALSNLFLFENPTRCVPFNLLPFLPWHLWEGTYGGIP